MTDHPPAPARTAPARPAFAWALGLMLASGFAGLGYQIVWTQQAALWLGHESAAVLAVVAAFFGGLAVGALALGTRIECSLRPARWYIACEVAIAVWGLALTALMAPISGWLLRLTGASAEPAWQWAVAFGGTFLLLLPATAAMGATLPAMHRVLMQGATQDSQLAGLYGGNTLGAVVGVLACAFWLVPSYGLARTAMLCVGLNLLCALVAWRLWGRTVWAGRSTVLPARLPGATALLWTLAATGLLGIGYEVLVVRVLSQVAENTVYTFALLLAVYLVGSALGAAAYQRWWAARHDAAALRDRLLWWQLAACGLGAASLWGAELLKAAVLQAAGPSLVAALAAEALLALAAFGLPTLVMGALFSHLSLQAGAAGVAWGRALGVNTLGAAVAPWLWGVCWLPLLGPKGALLLLMVGYLGLLSRRCWRALPAWGVALAVLALAVGAPALMFVEQPPGAHIVSYREGPMAAVSVVEDAQGVRRLRIDNRQQEGSSASGLADSRQALLPLLLHPAPKRALFLGLGTGMTASAAAAEATLQVDAVELLPEVIEAARHFELSPRLHLLAADARRYVRTTPQRYDLIVADNFHPARSGSGSLYTVEHFQAVRSRLAEGGLFCQWLPLHQLDLPTLRSIVQAFVRVYPGGWALLATHSLETPVLGLVAHADGQRFQLSPLRQRLADVALPRDPAAFGLPDDLALLGSFVAGPQALARFAGQAPLNTDDHPVVAYQAPRITYVPDTLPRDRLVALLHELQLAPEELIDSSDDNTWPPRLAAYWAARNHFIEAGRAVQPTADVQRMLAQVREPLLAVLRTSPDFRPAYDPLLRMAQALAASDVAGARALLTALRQVQPARPEAQQLLQALP